VPDTTFHMLAHLLAIQASPLMKNCYSEDYTTNNQPLTVEQCLLIDSSN